MSKIPWLHLLAVFVGVVVLALVAYLLGALATESLVQFLGFVVVVTLALTIWGETLGKLVIRHRRVGFVAAFAAFLLILLLRPFAIIVYTPMTVLVFCILFEAISCLPAWMYKWEEWEEAEAEAEAAECARRRQAYVEVACETVDEYCGRRFWLESPANLAVLQTSIKQMTTGLVFVGAYRKGGIDIDMAFRRIGFDPAKGNRPFAIYPAGSTVEDPQYTAALNDLFEKNLAELS